MEGHSRDKNLAGVEVSGEKGWGALSQKLWRDGYGQKHQVQRIARELETTERNRSTDLRQCLVDYGKLLKRGTLLCILSVCKKSENSAFTTSNNKLSAYFL